MNSCSHSVRKNCGRRVHAAAAAILVLAIPALGWAGSGHTTAMTPMREYYISPSGNDSNPGTKGAPFLTFQKADLVIRPGVTIHVLPGTYSGYTARNTIKITANGTRAARIRWVAEKKWQARIVGHVNPANGLGWGIAIQGSYVDLVGFDVTSNANMGIWVLGSHVRVIGNHVHDIPGQPGCSSSGASGIEQGNYSGGYMEVNANVVHNIGAGGPGSCNKYHGISLAAPYDSAVNNVSYHNASKGIGTWHAAAHNTISNNTVFDNDVGILVGAGDSPCNKSCLADYMIVSNNIIYNNKTIGFWQYSKAGRHNVYTHNLAFANRVRDVLLQGNCAHPSSDTCNSFVKAVYQDPQFVNATGNFFTGDYHLKPISPAVKAGTFIGEPRSDFDGCLRIPGYAPDLGVFRSAQKLEKKAENSSTEMTRRIKNP